MGGRRKSLVWLLVGLISVALIGGLAFYHPFESQAGTPEETAAQEADPVPPPPKLPGKRVTFLVMGVDKRPDDTGRSDSMLVISYDPNKQQLAALSLARDTWAQIPGHGYDKINHAYAYGGDRLAMAAVQRLVGIPIDHYVTVSFQGFAKIVDALGGVDVDAEKRMYYVDPSDTSMGPDGLLIDIQKGPQHMDGLTALKYSRFRHDDEADFGRIRRQQQVMKAMATTAATPAVIMKIPQLAAALQDAVDTDLALVEMVKLATGGKEAVSKPMRTGTFAGTPKTIAGIDYLIPDLVEQRAAAYDILVGDTPSELFKQRAKEDQQAYMQALALATGGDRTASRPGGSTAQTGPGGPGDAGATEPSKPTTTAPTTGATKGTQPTTTAPKPQPLTIAVIDATGNRQVSQAIINKLKAAGFRIPRVSRVTKTVARTVALDHAGQPGTADRIHQVLPDALVVESLDPKAEEPVELVLGTDLVKTPTR